MVPTSFIRECAGSRCLLASLPDEAGDYVIAASHFFPTDELSCVDRHLLTGEHQMQSQIRKILVVSSAIGLCLGSTASADSIALDCEGTAQVNLFAGQDYKPPKGDEIPPVPWGVDENLFRAAGGVFQFSHPVEFQAQIEESRMIVDAEGYGGVFEHNQRDGSAHTADATTQASDFSATETGYFGWLHTRYAFDSDYGARPVTLAAFEVDRETGRFEFRGLRLQGAGVVGPEFGVDGGTAERFDIAVLGTCVGFPETRP